MRSSYRGYYPPTEAELETLWNDGLIVPDTNTLLHLYRYSKSAAVDLFNVLSSVEDRLWLPHQVGLEFQRGRIGVIEEQQAAFGVVLDAMNAATKDVETALRRFRKHPELDHETISGQFKAAIRPLEERIEGLRGSHLDAMPVSYLEDQTWDRLTTMFEGRIGAPLDQAELLALYTEGAQRYEQKIPPGYRDAKKAEPGRYGDLILWKQLLKHVAAHPRACIFVTDDDKEDWWRVEQGKTLGPRVELIEEFWEACGHRVHFYSPDRFMFFARERIAAAVSEDSIGEARDVSAAARDEDALASLLAFRDEAIEYRQQLMSHFKRIERDRHGETSFASRFGSEELEHQRRFFLSQEAAARARADDDGIDLGERDFALSQAYVFSRELEQVEAKLRALRAEEGMRPDERTFILDREAQQIRREIEGAEGSIEHIEAEIRALEARRRRAP